MRELTFKGFLERYLRSLAGTDTLSLASLARCMASGNARLAEPLYLYAALTDQRERLCRLGEGTAAEGQWAELSHEYPRAEDLISALEGNSSLLPRGYTKVYRSYKAVRDQKKTDRSYNERVRAETSKNLLAAGVSNYRAYTDLGLNPGNANSYLKHGDATKVSRAVANRLLSYSRQALSAAG